MRLTEGRTAYVTGNIPVVTEATGETSLCDDSTTRLCMFSHMLVLKTGPLD